MPINYVKLLEVIIHAISVVVILSNNDDSVIAMLTLVSTLIAISKTL